MVHLEIRIVPLTRDDRDNSCKSTRYRDYPICDGSMPRVARSYFVYLLAIRDRGIPQYI